MFARCQLVRQCVFVCALVQIGVLVRGLTTIYEGGMASYNFYEFAYKCRKVIGAGLNYKKMIKERNLDTPKTPVLFFKPPSSIITEPEVIEIPEGMEVHHEVELGVVISQRCKKVKTWQDGMNCIAGYCLALDLTDVKSLKHARANGLPWSIGKGFDTACPVSEFIPEHEVRDPDDLPLWLKVNGEMRQKSNTGDTVFKTGELIRHISQYMTLEPYDLILTGTPSGTGPLKDGDVIEAGLGKDLVHVKFRVNVV